MAEWKIKRDNQEFAATDTETLRAWARDGREAPSDYVWNPTLQQWMYARDAAELQGYFGGAPVAAAPRKSRTGFIALGCLTLFLLAAVAAFLGNRDGSVTRTRTSSGSSTNTPSASPVVAPAPAAPSLALISSRGYEAEHGGYHYVEGQVKNTSDQPIKNLMAVATWSDSNDGFIKSDDALVEYNPLLPGQTSPFKVISTGNPAMSKYRVEFKTIFGGTIDYEDLRDAPKKKKK